MTLNQIRKSYKEACKAGQKPNYIISACRNEDTMGGVTPFQRCWIPDLLAYRASSWATVLKLLLTCLKRQVSKDSQTWRIPCMRCPKLLPVAMSLIDWMAFKESDSTMIWDNYSSYAKMTACFKAMTSVSLAWKQAWRGLQWAATTWPLQSLMTTLTQEKLSTSKDAPSTFILWIPRGGGTQLDGEGGGVLILLRSQVAEQAKSSALFFANCHTYVGGSP